VKNKRLFSFSEYHELSFEQGREREKQMITYLTATGTGVEAVADGEGANVILGSTVE
jgi:hypothetical protein